MTQRWAETMVKKYAVVSTRCDNCHKTASGDPDDWVELSWGHNDWGNDSVESGDRWHACSPPCLMALFKRVAEEYEPVPKHPTLYVHVMGSLNYDWVRALGMASIAEQTVNSEGS